jgi:hypothetical protein
MGSDCVVDIVGILDHHRDITLCVRPVEIGRRTASSFFFPVSNTGTCFIQKYMPPPLPYFKVNICPLPLPHFASIFFAYLWSFRWPNYIVTLPRYFSFRLPHLNINIGPPSDELDKNIQRKSHFLFFSHWNGYSHFRSVLNWFRN